MPNSNYRRGARLERLWIQQMKSKGYQATRSAGSKGMIDCIAWNDHEMILVQIKNSRAAYSQKDVDALREMPRPPRAKVLLLERDGGVVEWKIIVC